MAPLNTVDLVSLRQLIDACADAVDRGVAADYRRLWTQNCALTVGGDEGTPPESIFEGDAVVGALDAVSHFYRTFHHMGGAVFEADPSDRPDRSIGRSYCLAHHYDRTDNGPVDLVMAIRYLDEYQRVDGRWLIDRRQVVIEWTELHSAHPPRRRRPPPS